MDIIVSSSSFFCFLSLLPSVLIFQSALLMRSSEHGDLSACRYGTVSCLYPSVLSATPATSLSVPLSPPCLGISVPVSLSPPPPPPVLSFGATARVVSHLNPHRAVIAEVRLRRSCTLSPVLAVATTPSAAGDRPCLSLTNPHDGGGENKRASKHEFKAEKEEKDWAKRVCRSQGDQHLVEILGGGWVLYTDEGRLSLYSFVGGDKG